MRFIPLGSGSSGNSTLVELGGKRLLVDAGLSARELGRRLEGIGVDAGSIDAILLSHEHSDHTRGAERLSRRHGIPVICFVETLEAMDCSPVHFADWVPFNEGAMLDVEGVLVDPFPIPHDAARPVGFVLHGEGLRVGIATDLGHATTLVRERLRGCHLQMLEFNHDDRMLQEGPYPWHLKQRVSSRLGHLSNGEAAALLGETADESCGAVVLAHLSKKNNTPALARATASAVLAERGRGRIEMRVASAASPTPAVRL